MNALDILSRCQTLGINLTPGDAGKLRVSPRGMVSDELLEQLQRHKPVLLQLLAAPPADFLSDAPCPLCGSPERWQWLDGRGAVSGMPDSRFGATHAAQRGYLRHGYHDRQISRDEYGARMDSLAVEERLRRLREQLLPLWERAQRQVMSTLEALERRHQGPAPLMAIGRVGQVNVAEQQVHVHARSGAPSQPGLAQP